MTNLILSGFKRLLKNRAFHITAVVVAAIGLFEILMMYRDSIIEMKTPYFDSGLFAFAGIGMFALAAVVSLFVGSEYSDGTIRNKLVVGHCRGAVYLSMLMTSIIAEVLLILVWTTAYLIPGAILMEHANPLRVYLILYLAMFLELAVLVNYLDQKEMTIDFRLSVENGKAVLAMDDQRMTIYWAYGDREDSPAIGTDEGLEDVPYPGADVVEIVNLRGDGTTIYKLADGSYMDRMERRFAYTGTDTWIDEDGVAWNEAAKD